jgi:hypothetical protein
LHASFLMEGPSENDINYAILDDHSDEVMDEIHREELVLRVWSCAWTESNLNPRGLGFKTYEVCIHLYNFNELLVSRFIKSMSFSIVVDGPSPMECKFYVILYLYKNI